MRRLIVLSLMMLASTCILLRPAMAERRVALVIGNAAYVHVPSLSTPSGDAAAIAAKFREARFDVVEEKHDLSLAGMRTAFRNFIDAAHDADVVVVYYAGHGLEVDGMNYLIPVDAVLERDSDTYDEAMALNRVLRVIAPARQLALVILDACRDNPFSSERTLRNRTFGRGLGGLEPANPNTVVAFAAKAGTVAEDGNGPHSPFTAALLRHLFAPGSDVRKVLGLVRDQVMKETHNRQEPFLYGSLGGDDVSLVPLAPMTTPSQVEIEAQAAVRRDYELARQVGTREGWQTFLRQYPEGFYSGLAKAQLNKIAEQEARSAAEKAQGEHFSHRPSDAVGTSEHDRSVSG